MLTDDQRLLLGQRLKELRQQRQLSAAQVAEQALGYQNGSHVAVTRLERALLSAPRRDHLETLATFFQVDPEFLLVSELPTSDSTPAPRQPAPAKPRATPRLTSVGQRIRHLRSVKELETADFADGLRQVGPIVLASDVEAWERDERQPNPVQLQALARFTGCTADWLMPANASEPLAA